MTTYSQLRYSDEFDGYYEKRFKRVKVVSDPIIEGSTVSLWIAPVPSGKPVKVRFVADAPVPVHADRIPPRQNHNKKYQEWILQALEPGMPAQSLREVGDLVAAKTGQRIPRNSLRPACNALATRGNLLKREDRFSLYRYPLLLKPGLAVQRYPMPNSGVCLGWVDEIKLLRSGAGEPQEFAIIRWLNGVRTPMADENLEPVTDAFCLKQIAVAQQVAQGDVPDGFIEVPWWILVRLTRPTRRGRSELNREAFLDLAVHLKLLKPDAERVNPGTINACIDYLEIFYPHWRSLQVEGMTA